MPAITDGINPGQMTRRGRMTRRGHLVTVSPVIIFTAMRLHPRSLTAHPTARRSLAGLLLLALLLAGAPVYAGDLTQDEAPVLPYAQGYSLHFERLSTSDGLSQSIVSKVLQDRRGYLWVGTRAGLNRFDGVDFTVYKYNPDRPDSLSDSLVKALYEDSDGNLWVGTQTGLNRFDPETVTFTRYLHDPDDPNSLSNNFVNVIMRAQAGGLWVGTNGGLNHLDPDSGRITRYPVADTSQGDHTLQAIILDLYQDETGRLWIATAGGLGRLDPPGQFITYYLPDPGDPLSLSNAYISTIEPDEYGTLWLGTFGLDRLSPQTGEFHHYTCEVQESAPQPGAPEFVNDLLLDPQGHLWIGTELHGLRRMSLPVPGTAPVTRVQCDSFRNDPGDLHSLSNDSVRALYFDRSGLLWVGTFGGGLNRFYPPTEAFRHYRATPHQPQSLPDNFVNAFATTPEGRVWVGTRQGGLVEMDPGSGRFTPIALPSTESGGALIWALAAGPDGTLWAGTWGAGLFHYDPSTGSVENFLTGSDPQTSLASNIVRSLLFTPEGDLWIGTRTGLSFLELPEKRFSSYFHIPAEPENMDENHIVSLYIDQSGMLWTGTVNGGLNRFDPQRGLISVYQYDPEDSNSLSHNVVLGLNEFPTGTLWAGTPAGLNRIDLSSEQIRHYTEADGLPNDTVYGILSDPERGELWLSTDGGLARFNPQSEEFFGYTPSDGLQAEVFNVGAYHRGPQGELFFGGVDGFNVFHPAEINLSTPPPPVVITAIKQFNRVVSQDPVAGLLLELDYDDNFIGFEYAALEYAAPGKIRYAYRLEGLDRDWIQAGDRRYADYPDLRPGAYTFQVIAAGHTGAWNETGAQVQVVIHPPFWGTWWFRVLGLLLLVGGVIGGFRLRVRQLDARNRELTEQVRARTAEIEARRRELVALYQADESLYRPLQLEAVLQSLVDSAVEILQADKSVLLLWDPDQEALTVAAARGFSAETLERMHFARGDGAAGQVFASGQAVIVDDTSVLDHPALTGGLRRDITGQEQIRSFIHIPIRLEAGVCGVFNASFLRPHALDHDKRRFFEALARRAALALESSQLYQQAQELAVTRERQRLARDLHDAVTQTLFSASLIAEVLPALWQRRPEQAAPRLDELRQLTRGALAEMRTLLFELRPAALAEAQLPDLLRQLVEAFRGRTRLAVEQDCQIPDDLPVEVKIVFYRIAQEALNNIAKHAGAKKVHICLQAADDRAILEVVDDGAGFDLDNIPPERLGLGIMHERAAQIRAQLHIDSRPGAGTRLRLVWSYPNGDPNHA